MEWKEIKEGLDKVSALSSRIYAASVDDRALFDQIEGLPEEDKKKLFELYSGSSGPVLGIRSQVVTELIEGPINRELIRERFQQGKKNAPKAYTTYKDLYSILYPFLTEGSKDLVRRILTGLAEKIRSELGLRDRTEIKFVGFAGARNSGSNRAWFAIYNHTYPNQKLAKQLFFSLLNEKATYALYDWGKDTFLDRVDVDAVSLEYADLLDFYRKHVAVIEKDNFRAGILAKYPLDVLIDRLRSGQVRSWYIKPGQGAFMWKEALEEGNIRIGWGAAVRDICAENNFDDAFVLGKLNEHHPTDNERQNNNKLSIRYFLKDVDVNDLVLAISGVSNVIGVGIVTSIAELDDEEDEYAAYHTVDWLIDLSKNPYRSDTQLPIKTVTPVDAERSVSILCSIFNYTPYSITDHMELPFLNTIFYGPPGTGKTYELNRLKDNLFTDQAIPQTPQEALREKVSLYAFWEVIAAVLGNSETPLTANEIAADAIVKAWLNPSNKTRPSTQIWSCLQAYADEESTEGKSGRATKLFHKYPGFKWGITESAKEDLKDVVDKELLELAGKGSAAIPPNRTTRKRYGFITFHQKYGYEDFIEGIRPDIRKEDVSEEKGDLKFSLEKGMFYNSCLEALKLVGYDSFEACRADTPENRVLRFSTIRSDRSKQFAVFIDEINRANISAVFGELITLLEADKRIGAVNEKGEPTELWLRLPYSGQEFCVPSNLYVIGTMNTADRSIALLDIALRRRFDFTALYPLYRDGEWWCSLLERLNTAIYAYKKSADFFIGHAFFMHRKETEKISILNARIVPLLLEYCQNNTEAVKKILTEAGIGIRPSGIRENFQIVAE